MANVIDLDKLENLKPDSNGWTAACPLCRHEGHDKTGNHLKIYPNGAFGCVLNQKDKAHNAGILQLVGTESDGILTYSSAPVEVKIEIPRVWPIKLLDNLIKDYSYFESRGISVATQEFFQMGFASTHQMAGRMILPIFNKEKTQIIGFSGRLVKYTDWHKENKIPKWKHLNKSSLFLWPYYPEEIIKAGSVILVESPGDVLYLWERGIKNVICLFGVVVSSKVLAYIISLGIRKIFISLNNELDGPNKGVGNKNAEKIKNKLLNYFNDESVVIALPPLKDFNEIHSVNEKLLDQWREKWLDSGDD